MRPTWVLTVLTPSPSAWATSLTERPDASWSEWSNASTSPGPIHSPGARFLQELRALVLRGAAKAPVSAL